MVKLRKKSLREQPWYEREAYGSFWERGYRDLSVSTLGGPSPEVIELAPALPLGAHVLDLGCGEGRNALYLAGRGCDVTAIDRSEVGIGKLKYLAERAGVKLSALVADVATLDIDDEYDLVMAHGLLHYLTLGEVHDLLKKIKEKTLLRGHNIYTYKYFNEEFPKPDEFRAARYTDSLGPNQLRQLYQDWDIVRYDVYAKWDRHPGLSTHCHPCEKLVAVKPEGADSLPYIVEPIPVGSKTLPSDVFSKIDVGMREDEVRHLCGDPDIVNTLIAEGKQFSAFSGVVDRGYVLHQWYYGLAMIEISDGQVRAKNLYKSMPVRMRVLKPRA